MTLLALDAGVRETGWAVFRSAHRDGANRMDETGIISLPRSIKVDGAARVKHLVRCLDELVSRWNPANVAYGQPSGIRWPVPSLQLLDDALVNWSANHRLPLYTYSAQEVRTAIAGHSHVPQDQLAYAIMARLGLIGQQDHPRMGGHCHRLLSPGPLGGSPIGKTLQGLSVIPGKSLMASRDPLTGSPSANLILCAWLLKDPGCPGPGTALGPGQYIFPLG